MDRTPEHLEAYAATGSLARRLSPEAPQGEVVKQVLSDPGAAVHARALSDVGTLVGETLVVPIAMLNPATITLTGSLAQPLVRDAVDAVVSTRHGFGRHPDVELLDEDDNRFVRACGAALALHRRKLHRQLHAILGKDRQRSEASVRSLTLPLRALPWESDGARRSG